MGDPIDDFYKHDAEQYAWLMQLPVCDVCGEPIQDDYYYDFGGDIVCEECLTKYLTDTDCRRRNDYL